MKQNSISKSLNVSSTSYLIVFLSVLVVSLGVTCKSLPHPETKGAEVTPTLPPIIFQIQKTQQANPTETIGFFGIRSTPKPSTLTAAATTLSLPPATATFERFLVDQGVTYEEYLAENKGTITPPPSPTPTPSPTLSPTKEPNAPIITFSKYYTFTRGSGINPAWATAVANTPPSDNPRQVMRGIIQFKQPHADKARDELRKAGIEYYNYYVEVLPEDWNRVIATAKILPKLEELVAEGRVLYAGPIPPLSKLNNEVFEAVANNLEGTLEIFVLLFSPPTETELDELSQYMTNVIRHENPSRDKYVMGSIKSTNIFQLAELPFIENIGLVIKNAVGNIE